MKRSPALIKLSALALACALPFAASAADGISYNYVQAGYTAINSDLDAKGWGAEGSVAVAPNFHVFGSYANYNVDGFFPAFNDVNIDAWRIGAGYNTAISNKVDFVGRAAYEKLDAGSGANADGYSLEAGVRASLAPKLEGYAMLGYEDGDGYNGDAYGRLGAHVKFNQNWGLAADVKVASGDTQWMVGPRLTW